MTTTITLEFPFVADKPTINGRIYSHDVLAHAVAKAQKAVQERRMLGELNSDSFHVRLSQSSHIVTDLRLEGDVVKGDIEVLPTDAGKLLAALFESKTPMVLMPMGHGDFHEVSMTVTDYSIDHIHVHEKAKIDGESP